MKKLLLLVACLFLLTSCKSKRVLEISLDEIESKIDNNESFIFYIGSSTCYNCKILKNNIKANKGVVFYYLDIEQLDKNVQEDLREKLVSKLPEQYFISNGLLNYKTSLYTPGIFKYVNGELVYTYSMSMSKDDVKKLYDFNLVDIGYYTNFLNYIEENKHFKITFYNSFDKDTVSYLENLSDELKSFNKIEYTIKYENIFDSEKSEIIKIYNEAYDKQISSFDELPVYFSLNY